MGWRHSHLRRHLQSLGECDGLCDLGLVRQDKGILQKPLPMLSLLKACMPRPGVLHAGHQHLPKGTCVYVNFLELFMFLLSQQAEE